MKIVARFLGSSLGKKYLMAVTGLLLVLFVIGHLVGNLQVLAGDGGEAINRYAEFLKSRPALLWLVRLGLLVTVGVHIVSAIQVARLNRVARPVGYHGQPVPPAASYASRTMLMGGLIIGAFVVYHLLHFTALVREINLTGVDFHALRDFKGRHDVYRMLVIGLSQPIVAGFYVVAIALLSLHLSHGVSALFQSLGLRTRGWKLVADEGARALAWTLFIGYVSIPACILFGLVK